MDSLLVINIIVNSIISAVKCAILPWTKYAHFNPVFDLILGHLKAPERQSRAVNDH